MTGFLKKLMGQESDTTIIIVSGLPRSGTSMMMKMLEAGGIPPLTDEIRAADADNPKGYYEFERVKGLDKGDTDWLSEAGGKSVKVISALLRHLPGHFQYDLIFMRRSIAEILASQNKMLANRGEPINSAADEQMAALFEKHLRSIDLWLQSQGNMRTLDIDYSEILAHPLDHIRRVNQFLGGGLDAAKMAAVIDPALYRNRQLQP